MLAAEAAEAAEEPELAAALYLQVAEKVDNDLIALTDGLQGIGARTSRRLDSGARSTRYPLP